MTSRGSRCDAVVIGGGINGMVAAAELAAAGWEVDLVERGDRLGGFIAAEELTLPGYVHDVYSSWHPLFRSGPAYASLGPDLERHGVRYVNAEGPVTASAGADGRVALAFRDVERSAAQLEHAADRRVYREQMARIGAAMPALGAMLGAQPRSRHALAAAFGLARRAGLRGSEEWIRDLVSGGRAWATERFTGGDVDHLWAPWLLHAGIGPDEPGGGLMLPLMAYTTHTAGLPVVRGGSGVFVDAFRALLEERGVRIRLGAEAERVLVHGGRATAVLAAGERLAPRRAVLASVTPEALYGRLLSGVELPEGLRQRATRFRFGRAAMQVHVALSEPLRWRDPRLAEVPLVHVSEGSASTAIACAEARAGLLPRAPTVVVGRQEVLDPTRVPAGAGALWLQLHELPFEPRGDAAGELAASGAWTPELVDSFVARVLERVADLAPNLRSSLLAVEAISPVELARRNPNAAWGDPYGGALDLAQSFLWRPLPGAGHRTPVEGLWQIGASTHPGAGVSGTSGHLVATELIRRAARPGLRIRHRAGWTGIF